MSHLTQLCDRYISLLTHTLEFPSERNSCLRTKGIPLAERGFHDFYSISAPHFLEDPLFEEEDFPGSLFEPARFFFL